MSIKNLLIMKNHVACAIVFICDNYVSAITNLCLQANATSVLRSLLFLYAFFSIL